MKKFAISTLGCKVNQYESSAIKEELIVKGYEYVSFDESADIYIINTCTVTNMAAKKSKQIIRRARILNKDAYVVVTGCLAQNTPLEIQEQTGADLVLGNSEKSNIVKFIEGRNNRVTDIMSMDIYDNMHISKADTRTRAYVKIQDGCVNFCTYCIIPFVRGPIRSRNLTDIINEITILVKNGVKEVVLTGIHLDSYGKDLENIQLIDVIKQINKINGLKRIRLGSLEPTIITMQFINEIKKLDKFCYHFHLSLQSGCDKTLKAMNREYTTKQFKDATTLIYDQLENSSITTDIIVGFPNESDDDFIDSYNFIKNIGFLKVHVFKYSRRKGTKAYNMANQINGNIKAIRSKQMMQLANEMTNNFLNQYINKKVEVLTEEDAGKYIKSHTKSFVSVLIEKSDSKLNEIYNVVITENKGEYLKGTISE